MLEKRAGNVARSGQSKGRLLPYVGPSSTRRVVQRIDGDCACLQRVVGPAA